MRCCQTICNFIPSFSSIRPIPILIIQCFSGWLSSFSLFFADRDVNLVHFHYYLLLSCSLLNPSVLEVVPPLNPKHCLNVRLPLFSAQGLFTWAFSLLLHLSPHLAPFTFFICLQKLVFKTVCWDLFDHSIAHIVTRMESTFLDSSLSQLSSRALRDV